MPAAQVVTRGFGSFGSIAGVVLRGFTSGEASLPESLRKLIRQFIVQALIDAATAAGANVFDYPIRRNQSNLPALEVYTPVDRVAEKLNDTPLTYVRDLTVIIKAIAQGNDSVGVVDDLANEVELALIREDKLAGVLGGNVENIDLEETITDVDGDGKRIEVEAAIQFSCRYYTDHGPVENRDFLRVHGDFDAANPDGEIEASDDVDIPQ